MSDMQSVNLTNQSVHQNRSKPGSNSSTPSNVSSVFRHHKGRRCLSHPSVFYPAVACRQKKQMMKDNYFTLASAPVLPVGWYTRYTLLGVAMANKQHNTTTKKTVVYAPQHCLSYRMFQPTPEWEREGIPPATKLMAAKPGGQIFANHPYAPLHFGKVLVMQVFFC